MFTAWLSARRRLLLSRSPVRLQSAHGPRLRMAGIVQPQRGQRRMIGMTSAHRFGLAIFFTGLALGKTRIDAGSYGFISIFGGLPPFSGMWSTSLHDGSGR